MKQSRLSAVLGLVILVAFSFLPIYRTLGTLSIGYDTLVPLVPENSFKMIYQWTDMQNGTYIANNIFFWNSIFFVLTKIGLNIYQAAFFYQFLIYFFSALGIFYFYNLYNKGHKLFGLLPAIFIIISPHNLDHQIYYQGTVGIIWSLYFVFKFLKFKKLTPLDLVFCTLSFALIADLPNPKYHFLIILTVGISFALALLVRLINFRDLLVNKLNFLLLTLSTLFLSVPYLFYGLNFLQNSGEKINVKLGYKETGVALDHGLALISRMIRLFHTPNLIPEEGKLIDTPLFSLFFYIYPIVVLAVFPLLFSRLDKKSQRVHTIFYIIILIFLFISKSSNPPFGFFYDYVLSSQKAFAFMRTTAGIVIFISIFYVLIYSRIFQLVAEGLKNRLRVLLLSLLILIPVVIGYPVWSGRYFFSRFYESSENKNTRRYGFIIPDDYFKSAAFLKKIELDTKIDVYPFVSGYQHNSWSYYGFLLYPWLIDKPMISFDKKTELGREYSQTNAFYIYYDKTLSNSYDPDLSFIPTSDLVFTSRTVDIYKKNEADFWPHLYSPDFASLKSSLEFKKINPTKYKLLVRDVEAPFNLIFFENFNPLWKVYLKDYAGQQKSTTEQFVSNNFKGTVQNNNLSHGNFWETFLMQELKLPQTKVNGYANNWLVEPEKICQKNPVCMKNADGSYNLELVLEFWPQKLANFSYLISALTIVGLIIFQVKLRLQKNTDL